MFASLIHFNPKTVQSDLVPRSRFSGSRTKQGGRRMRRERRELDLAKYDCVGQNLAHGSTVHAPSLTCFSCVQYSDRADNVLRFAFENVVH